MATADELLTRLADPEEEPHIVITSDRLIMVPDKLRRIAVRYDHNIETVTFDCPRYWDDHDMSTMEIRIIYQRSDRFVNYYIAKNVSTEGDIMHFDWTIERDVTAIAGSLSVQVCIRNINADTVEENHWNSEINNDMRVSDSLLCGDEIIVDEHPKRIIILTDQNNGIDYELYVSDTKLMMKEWEG